MTIIATRIDSMEQRAQKVLDQISGVVSLYGVTSYEMTFLRDMVNRHISFGTHNQRKFMEAIEEKVNKGDMQDG